AGARFVVQATCPAGARQERGVFLPPPRSSLARPGLPPGLAVRSRPLLPPSGCSAPALPLPSLLLPLLWSSVFLLVAMRTSCAVGAREQTTSCGEHRRDGSHGDARRAAPR